MAAVGYQYKQPRFVWFEGQNRPPEAPLSSAFPETQICSTPTTDVLTVFKVNELSLTLQTEAEHWEKAENNSGLHIYVCHNTKKMKQKMSADIFT